MLSEGLQILREEVRAIQSVVGLAPNFICYPIPTNAIDFMARKGGNALGISTGGEPLFRKRYHLDSVPPSQRAKKEPSPVILISTGWSNASDDTAVQTMTTNVVQRTRSAARRAGVAHPYVYLNYAAAGRAEEVFAGYGQENVDRLREIQAAVDSDGVFTANGLWRGFMKLW